ncbi:MAG TPA: M20 family metallopeptidase [Bryobacteraceae bacterium]|nr:M20 family metallopeptidase [Bryobacteraceae bacterium]
MHPLLSWARAREAEVIGTIGRFVECESPSGDAAALGRFADLIADTVSESAKCRKSGQNLLCAFDLPGRKKKGQILALGHLDTVWRLGTIQSMPFRQAKGRLWGPGVLDMKSGLAFLMFAARALRELDMPVSRGLLLQVNCDEETGSAGSRALTEANAKRSEAVLVLEPGTGLTGKLKTERKGVGDYRVSVRGIAAHAGVDFENGASAVVELAKQIDRISGFTDLRRGITVNPGVISGGTRSNVIAEHAEAHVDIRIRQLRDAAGLEKKFHSLRAFDKRCSVQVAGGLNRPPMEKSAGGRRLYRLAQTAAEELGVTVEESATGGGSDGNFTAALGVPTLDGLGAAGEGAHAKHESILVSRIADRIALLARLITLI